MCYTMFGSVILIIGYGCMNIFNKSFFTVFMVKTNIVESDKIIYDRLDVLYKTSIRCFSHCDPAIGTGVAQMWHLQNLSI